jgi:hypothetical protein
MAGVTLTVFEGTLFVEDIALGGNTPAASNS